MEINQMHSSAEDIQFYKRQNRLKEYSYLDISCDAPLDLFESEHASKP
jgi:hypothetical protein